MATTPAVGEHNLVATVPKDILVDVLARVALQSLADLFSAKLTCKAFLEASSEDYIYRNVTITQFPVIPWKTNLAARTFLDCCITTGNPEALFLLGLIEYLSTLQLDSGPHNLRSVARTGHPESIYIYGVLMLCQGQQEEGLALLRSLEGQVGGLPWLEMVRYCRKRVKSVVMNMWVRNWMIMAGAGEQNRGRICGCRREDEGFMVLPSPESTVGRRSGEGWASREEEELDMYAINRCRSCFWNHEAAAFCNMLRFGSFQF